MNKPDRCGGCGLHCEECRPTEARAMMMALSNLLLFHPSSHSKPLVSTYLGLPQNLCQ
ncbi:MAG: hypothetical protein PHQ34_16145 [Methanothrix sp.]|nr:hypothetical protein [Methanothrix sp.]